MLSDPRLLGDTGGEMRGTSTGVGLGLSGTSCPSEYGGCTLALPSFSACSFHVFLNLHRDKDKPHRCLAPPVTSPSEEGQLSAQNRENHSFHHQGLCNTISKTLGGGRYVLLVPLTNGETEACVAMSNPLWH